ncbi:MAG: CRISPR-associated endonuclease Cas2 [Chloroflexota bacterium]|nr:CRISPR-associated endonuclease Cas2 [Chloroflexota bacterium]
MTRQFMVVVYDISADKRRTKLHNVLLNYGTPVQYSVFECLLKPARVTKLKAQVARVIHPREDQVRYYYLCATCLAKTEVTSGPEVLHQIDVLVV